MTFSKRVQKLVDRHAERLDLENCYTEPGTFFSDDFHPKREYWLYLGRGWRNAEVDPLVPIHLIHEVDFKEIKRQIEGAKPCDCDECKNNW